VNRLLATFNALLQASDELHRDAPSTELLSDIIASKLVRPADNEALGYWFARYLTIRQELWDLINDCLESGNRHAHGLNDEQVWSHFVVGYSAACLLIRNDRHFLFDIATHSVVQRKFNEAFSEYRIPRKQYTKIFSAFVDGRDALRIYDAIRDAKTHRSMIEQLCNDPVVGKLARQLPEFEKWLDPSKRSYLQRLLSYISHKWRRKSVVVLNNLLSRTTENVGRAASQVKLPLKKRVPRQVRMKMISELEPGDVLITRHDNALTNLFLPGFWPHAALFIGTEEQREQRGINIDADKASRWTGDNCVLEALKDGVRFRPITETLAVDNFLVLRPNISDVDIQAGIERVVLHEGKLYNFDFDFFSSDRLVCSEVVYRAFDGLGGLTFPLVERAGRYTLSPEDLVDFAINTDSMSIKGIFGVDISRAQYLSGELAEKIAIKTVG